MNRIDKLNRQQIDALANEFNMTIKNVEERLRGPVRWISYPAKQFKIINKQGLEEIINCSSGRTITNFDIAVLEMMYPC